MHTKQKKNNSLVLIILLLLLFSCKKEEEENFVVKVGNSVLTEAIIEESIDSSKSNKFREEFIREWIEKKLIYLDAISKDVVNSDEYNRIIDEAKVDVANALAVKKMISKNPVSTTNKVLEKFYVENIKLFKVSSPRLIYNKATFLSKVIATKFRKIAISKGWENAVKYFSNNRSQFSIEENKLEYLYNILPEYFANQIFKISENEFSKVIETSKNTFAVVQMIKRYYKNDVLEFDEIKDEIKVKYISYKQKELYNNYLKELYNEYSSEIKR